eukprot:TRINITY_DN1373_c0_g1_i1.p1 TRINITY_DN1373_c0_g1~~TRINITY_DN1373_c0_g1_i1.p1  ORF type:complete len:180 (+),score=41.02 TRINITY_DN1373_c0_g1_i1:317-856(+)
MEEDHGIRPPDHLQSIEDSNSCPVGSSTSEGPDFEFATGGVNLEETIREVKESVWSFGDATMRGIAELLMGFGFSPEVVGYTEEDFIDEKYDEGRSARTGNKDAVVASSSYAQRTMTSTHHRRTEEVSSLKRTMLDDVSEGDAHDSMRQDFDDRRGIIGSGGQGSDDEEIEYGEDKKDK